MLTPLRIVACAAAIAATMQVPTAMAAPVPGEITRSVEFDCAFPLIGTRPVKTTIAFTAPATAKVGERVVFTNFHMDVVLDTRTSDGLRLVGAATLEGTAEPELATTVGPTTITSTLEGMTIPRTAVPALGATTVRIIGDLPGLRLDEPGTLTLAVGTALDGLITPRLANGEPTRLGTFPMPCTAKSGQDLGLTSIPVTS